MRHAFRFSAALLLTLALAPSAKAQDVSGIMIEAFGWATTPSPSRAWWDNLSDKAPQLRALGITGFWAPPATKAAGGGFSDGYDLYDYYDLGSKNQMGTVATKWGTKEQYLDFIGVAHANGMDVYADIVCNQRCGGGSGGVDYSHLVGAEAVGRFTMGPWDFHPSNSTGDWNEWMGGMPDVAQENPVTKQNLFNWIRWYDQQTGVDGYRLDAAKNMPFDFQEGFMYQFQEGMGPNRNRFVVSEYYDGNPSNLEYYVDAVNRRASVFDYQGDFTIHSMCHGNGYFDMRQLSGGLFESTDSTRSVTFVNNHDTEGRGNGMDTFIRANMGYAFIMAAPGYPCIYWPDLFDGNGNIQPYFPTCCWVHAFLAHGAAIERWADDDLYVMEREGNLLAGFNDNTISWRNEWVQTSFGSNVHLHDYTGQTGDVWTNQDGWVQISVPPSGYVFLGRDGLEGQVPNPPARRTTQQYEGNMDMDMPRAGEFWSQPIKFVSDKGQPIHVEVYLQDTTLTPHVCLIDSTGKRLNHVRGANGTVVLDYNNPPGAEWYQVLVGLEITGKGNRTPYWTKITYQAPTVLPSYSTYPTAASATADVLPLVSTSVGP
jgi:alpha-amylase